MASTFWDAEGLKRIAELVQVEAEKSSQKEIAKHSEVSEQTISNLLLNRYNTEGKIVKPPQPDTMLKVAPNITNPETGQGFEPEEFLAIARGRSKIPAKVAEESATYQVNSQPFPSAVREIRRLMGKLTIAQAATQWDIDPARLEELLTSIDPNRAVPNGIEVHRIARNYPDKLANRLLQHYAEPQKVNGKLR